MRSHPVQASFMRRCRMTRSRAGTSSSCSEMPSPRISKAPPRAQHVVSAGVCIKSWDARRLPVSTLGSRCLELRTQFRKSKKIDMDYNVNYC